MVPAATMSWTRWADCCPEPARVQPRPAHHAVGLLAGLRHDAADDLLDQLGIDPGPGQHLTLGLAQERGGVEAGEPAVALAERGADGVDDHRSTHGQSRTCSCSACKQNSHCGLDALYETLSSVAESL
jgi:hypothetical protein